MAKFTRDLTAICWVLGIAAYTYGYGNASFITILGQPGFYISMGLDSTTEHTANIIGACNALFTAGAAVGSLLQGFVADRIGRKGGLAVASGLSLIGGALVAGAVNIPMIITVRLLQGLGLGMLICLVPLYLAETAPPNIRGFMSGLTVLAFGFGYETCAVISIGSYFAKNHVLQWRLPLGLACLSPILLLALLPIIPESPRYLVWKGQNEKALMILKKLHHNPTNEGDCLATAEFVQIQRQVEHDKELKAGYLDILRRPSWRKRALCVLFLLFASQSTGILGIANFMVLISEGLGFKGVIPIVIFTTWSLTGTVGVIISIYLVDRVGRRILLLCGYVALTFILLSEALLEMRFLGTTEEAGLAACMLFLFFYILAYQCVDAPSFVWATEVWPTTLRAKGASLAWFAYFCGAITYTTPGALMLKNIKWHVYLLYMSLCAISAVIVYFFIPETKGLPMEELAALFGDEVMVRLTADGQGVIKPELDDMFDPAPLVTGDKDKIEGGVHVEEVSRS